MTEKDVADLVEAVLGESVLHVRPLTLTHSGNKIWEAVLETREVIVRCRDDGKDQFAHTSSNLVRLASLGLPVPQCVAQDSSRIRYPFAYMILAKLPGRDLLYELPQMTRPQMTRLAAQIVDAQKAVMTLPLGPGYGWGPIGGGGAEPKWFFMFQSEADAIPPLDDGTTIGRLRRRLHRQQVRFQPYFRRVAPTCFLEDLTTKNVLLQNGALSGLIDFDSVCFGDPLWMIGLAMGCIVADVDTAGLFYPSELCRLWPLTPEQQQIVHWYAAQRATEFLAEATVSGPADQIQRLQTMADQWLSLLEG